MAAPRALQGDRRREHAGVLVVKAARQEAAERPLHGARRIVVQRHRVSGGGAVGGRGAAARLLGREELPLPPSHQHGSPRRSQAQGLGDRGPLARCSVRKKIKIKKGEDDVIHARLAIHRGGGGAAEASGGAGGREAQGGAGERGGMRYRWAAALALLAAALARASAHSLEDAAAAAAAHTGSAGPDELMQMLHAASKKMSLEQLGELRAVMRHMKDSAERRSAAQREHPGGRRLLVDRTLRPAYSYNSGQVTDAHMSGRDYGVILYPKKPFVVIEDPPPVPGNLAVQDPGNLNQTRTPANGLLSGLTVDLLESVAVELGVTLRYYYPCARTNYDSTGACVDATDSDALNWLKDGDTDAMAAKYFGNMTEFCGGAETYQCFVASATEISAERVQAFRMTQPFMDTGFALVVKENKANPPLMSAFLPFSALVWFMTIVEIIFVGMAFIFVEGYGTNEALWAAPDTSGLEGSAKVLGIISGFFVQLYDAAYWSTTILLGEQA